LEKTSDDGEPKGTAGQQILREITGRFLTNTTVTVTRYFGGTKLGTGNLARAYAECAAASLDKAAIIRRYIFQVYELECSFDDQSIVYHVASKCDAIVEHNAHSTIVSFNIRVPLAKHEMFVTMLRNMSSGRLTPRMVGQWIS
jgi:putative IMPACT (imprinted ancient) family translation regulator